MVAYNSALGACGKARSAELALELLKRMDRQQADLEILEIFRDDVSNENNPGCLGSRGDYTILCYRDYKIYRYRNPS